MKVNTINTYKYNEYSQQKTLPKYKLGSCQHSVTPCDAVLQLHVAFGLQQVPHALVHSAIHRMMERRSTDLRRRKIPVPISCGSPHVNGTNARMIQLKLTATGPIVMVCNHVANFSWITNYHGPVLDPVLPCPLHSPPCLPPATPPPFRGCPSWHAEIC